MPIALAASLVTLAAQAANLSGSAFTLTEHAN
jgi:hypothetical protein